MGYQLNKDLASRFGAAGYITKPVDLTELLKLFHIYCPQHKWLAYFRLCFDEQFLGSSRDGK